MIVRNEEANIGACLESARSLFAEVIVVDTGSTDRTKEIAESFGTKVVDFPWCDSFAAARNEGLKHATGDWVFWLDADDRLDEENREKLRGLFASLGDEPAAYVLKCVCLPDASGVSTVVDHVRLFRNDPAVRWEHRVHEQLLPALRRAGHAVRWADARVHHTGYQDTSLRARKLQRDLRLLEMERQELGEHPFTLFNLGQVYRDLGRHDEALAVLKRSLELSQPADSIVRKLYSLIAGCHLRLGRPAEAVATCRQGLAVCPEDGELLFLLGGLLEEQGDLDPAEECFNRLLAPPKEDYFASVADGLRTWKARHHLASICRAKGRHPEAAAHWQAALAERPDFLPARLGLAELHLEGGRFEEVEAHALALEAGGAAVEAAVLRARGLLARREFGRAGALLEAVIANDPRAVWPRLILTHVLLQEGKDPEAAERALKAVLELDPHNAQATHNLTLLRAQRRRLADQAFAGDLGLPGAPSA
jgi:tetratricopeptide (TPR) repeat protein